MPLLACFSHLGLPVDSPEATLSSAGWDWTTQPLRVVGEDKYGDIVCCLAYGRYQEIYLRALSGITAIFGLAVNLVDVEYLLSRHEQNKLLTRTLLGLARYFPGILLWRLQKPVSTLVEYYLNVQQEGRR